MLRRDFLKYLSVLPFLGSLLAQGESGASKGQPEKFPISPLAQMYKGIYGDDEYQRRIRRIWVV
jgi:hypothetical protein